MSEDFWDALTVLRLLVAMLAIGGGILGYRDLKKGQGDARWYGVLCGIAAATVFISIILEWLFKP